MKTKPALAAVYRQADKTFIFILWALLVVALALSGLHDTLGWAIGVGLPIAIVGTITATLAGGTRLSRFVMTAAVMAMCALHIHQGNGRDELHFGIFVALAFLLYYRDWMVIAFAAGLAAVHHLSFGYLQELGYGVLCFTEPGFGIVIIHAGYVVAETLVLCHLALLLERESLRAAELQSSVTALRPHGDIIDLSPQAPATSTSGKALQEGIAKIRTSIAHVQNSAETTRATAIEIADGSARLLSRTKNQSAAIRDAASTMADVNGSVAANAADSERASGLATSASAIAVRGGEQMANVVARMAVINEAAHRIAAIVGVIEGIAFKTNILALNAAIEAARAGEQGRAFAIVAAEVQNLSKSSSAAALEIKALIEASVAQVDAGATLAHEAGRTVDEIVASVTDVARIIGELSRANSAQAVRVAAVSNAISAMDKSTDQNALMAQETAHGAQVLQEQSQELSDVVGVFVLAAPQSR